MRALERPLGSELLSAAAALGAKLRREKREAPEFDSLLDAVRTRPQPLALPVWHSAAELARVAQPWFYESVADELHSLGFLGWPDEEKLLNAARNGEAEEQAALYAALLATSDRREELASEVADVARELPSPTRAILFAWCASAASLDLRPELVASTLAALHEAVSTEPFTDAGLLATVGLSAPRSLDPLLANETMELLDTVPREWRDISLIAEWLERALPKPPPERLRWRLIKSELGELLERLDAETRHDLIDEYLDRVHDRWTGAPPPPAAEAPGDWLPPPPPPDVGPAPYERETRDTYETRPTSRRKRNLIGVLRDLLLGEQKTGEVLSSETQEEQPRPRHLNLALADEARSLLAPSQTLLPERTYFVRIDIGERSSASLVVNPTPFPAELLEPSSPEGYWLHAVLVSSDLEVTPAIHRFFLPFIGSSWVCNCEGPEHTCDAGQRNLYLHVPITTRETNLAASLRCTIYHRNNAVQSASLRLVVADGSERPEAQQAVIDYTLSSDFTDLNALSPRRINVLTNETPDGTHRIVVKGDETLIPVDLTEAAVSETLRAMRDELRRISLGDEGSRSQYDDDNRCQTSDFIGHLKTLATLGSYFWVHVIPQDADRLHLKEVLQRRSTIQVARVSKLIFPWALVYDIPHEFNQPWILCPLLESWDERSGELASYPEACPSESKHGINVLCPYGFWGFKHSIEQPPSVRHGVLKSVIRVGGRPQAAVARNLELDEDVSNAHFEKLDASLGSRFRLARCDSREALRSVLADPALPLVYFYCHGRWGELGVAALRVPYLEIGHTDRVGPTDFAAWSQAGKWGSEHWLDVSPLIFINGCETAELTPEGIVNFVEALAGMNAAGVVGTEISVSQRVASELGERFFDQLAASPGESVGIALYRARIDLLRKGNVTGLIYTPFCSMDLVLAA